MQCKVAWLAVTLVQARVQLLRCIWCIIGCYLRHRACLEHAKLQSASGQHHKSAVTVSLYTVSIVQIFDSKCEWCCRPPHTCDLGHCFGSFWTGFRRDAGSAVFKNVCVNIYTHIHIHTYTYIYTYTYMRTYTHTYIHTYTRTYTHTHA